ncbi:MAG: NAD(P)/FAD-dependent oxidoreductase [Beijerinckiaceae bacterium]|nr:NAD(P)/FAD-dependent oxidoreductase [Beijerinckiaceae bacterium]MCI0734983.1 NAD(P)/FAD-dependent oxidoreductase [Beijerinckiaceae bacterium]
MNSELQIDLCIIGGGPGGISLALGAAAHGQSVVLVEKGELGGRRLTESIPRHALLAMSRAADGARNAAVLGIAEQEPQIDFARIRQHAAAVLAAITPNYARARLEAMNVKVIRAPGRFTRPDTCEARGAKIKARRFVVATGSVARRLPIPGLDAVRPIGCAALCALDRPPRCLIVVGTDPQGLAVAQALRRLGSGVIVVADQPLLAAEDDELAAPVRAAFARDGVVIHEGVRISRIEPRGDGVRVFIAGRGQEMPVAGSHILVAAGSVPDVEGLGLDAARVRYDESGIETDASLATSNRRIHAIGAAVRGISSEGAAEWHARAVLRAILGLPGGRITKHAVARVILTSPAIAVAGLSEAQARAASRHIRVLRWPLAETERARIEGQPGGHVKLITNRAGVIAGAGITGQGAEELITLLALAISKGMTVNDIGSIMLPYPALASAAHNAATAFLDKEPRTSLERLIGEWNRLADHQAVEIREFAGDLAGRVRRFLRGKV